MRILGITGGIATGKSAVTQMFADLGAPTISADTLAHELLLPGTDTTCAVLAAFPDAVGHADPNGLTIDRRALGHLIFADPAARAQLESLTHPAIIAALTAQILQWRTQSSPRAAAAEIPLLFEANLESLVDTIIVVACAETTQVARLCERSGLDEAEARRRIAAQWPLSEKVARADVVITTNGNLEDTRRQVQMLWMGLR